MLSSRSTLVAALLILAACSTRQSSAAADSAKPAVVGTDDAEAIDESPTGGADTAARAAPAADDVSCEQSGHATETALEGALEPSAAFLATLAEWRDAVHNGDGDAEAENAAKLIAFFAPSGFRHVDVNGIGENDGFKAKLDTTEQVSIAELRTQLANKRGAAYDELGYLADTWGRLRSQDEALGYCPLPAGFVTVIGEGIFTLTWKPEGEGVRLTRIALVEWQQE